MHDVSTLVIQLNRLIWLLLFLQCCRRLRNSIIAMAVEFAGMSHIPKHKVACTMSLISIVLCHFSFFFFSRNLFFNVLCYRIGGRENFFHCYKCGKLLVLSFLLPKILGWSLKIIITSDMLSICSNYIYIWSRWRLLLLYSLEEQPPLCGRSYASWLPCLLRGNTC